MTATVLRLPAAPTLQLTVGQARALELIQSVARAGHHTAPFAVVTGFAGTGKTTLLKLCADLRPLQLAPTGKAALRLQEATGRDSMTIHRAIYSPREDKDGHLRFDTKAAAAPIGCRAILVDETSMVGAALWRDLLREAGRLQLPVIAIGDPFQLPPVSGPGEPPFSVLSLPTAYRVALEEVVRQAQDNPIIAASMKIRAGDSEGGLAAFSTVPRNQLVATAVEVHRAGGVIITFRNVVRFKLNAAIRRSLGIPGLGPVRDEPLLVTRNETRLELFNGQLVRFLGWAAAPERIELPRRAVQVGVAELEGGARAFLCLEDLHGQLDAPTQRDLQLELSSRCIPTISPRPLPYLRANFGYVLTAHKAQGSEWDDVLVLMEPGINLDQVEGRQWLYTAVTRARRSVRIAWGGVR